jgi:hypothetical protein
LIKQKGKKRFLEKRIYQLKSAREYFIPRELSEHKALFRDTHLANRDKFFEKDIYTNDHYKDYLLKNGSYLRMRILHPDKPEHIFGADLIYEVFDLKRKLARFVHLQYKSWNTNVLYFSDKRMKAQIAKMEKNLCESGYCHSHDGNKHSLTYRLPFCSAFLRPTSKLQNNDSKLISTGIHIPICSAKEIVDIDNKITSLNTIEQSVSYNIFEELFVNNSLGSRWVKMDELDQFYEEKGFNSLTDNIRIHAQEVI